MTNPPTSGDPMADSDLRRLNYSEFRRQSVLAARGRLDAQVNRASFPSSGESPDCGHSTGGND